MGQELKLATELFAHIATEFQENPHPALDDSFEEWLFWKAPSEEHYRSARGGVARVDVPGAQKVFVSTLWQSLLEHPDLLVEDDDTVLGIECKSLQASPAFIETGADTPCRTTLDFNSTVPCGREMYKGKFQRYRHLRGQPIRVFYACALYGSIEEENRLLSFLLIDGNYINRDFDLHRKHRNVSRSGFGSYGDGKIRDRKMYIFPNPLTDSELQGTVSFVVEEPSLDRAFPHLVSVSKKAKRTRAGVEHIFYVYRYRLRES